MLAIAAMRDSSSAAAARGAVVKDRAPTPDHPPYSWMIGEAIAALDEGGGSAEDAISGFIRAKHPGVPAAHDRFLRHYLAKHVAEGLFVCTPPGRYSRAADDDDDEPVLALEEGPATEVKRRPGRPRKDGSAPRPTPASGKKVGSESQSATPKRRGRPRKDASPVAPPPVAPIAASLATEGKRGRGRPRKDSSPAAPPPVAARAASPSTDGKRGPGQPSKDGSSPPGRKKGPSGSPPATPKRRGRPRMLPLTALTDVSGKEGGDAPSATGNKHGESRELAVAVGNDGSTAPSVTEDDGGESPSAKLPLVAKKPATFTQPERSTEPCKLALVGTDPPLDGVKEAGTQAPLEGSAPPLVPDKGDGTQALFEGSASALASDKEDGVQTPFKDCRTRTLRSAPAKATRPAATPIAENKAGDNAASAPPKGRGRQLKLASAAAGELQPPRPAPKPRKMFLLNAVPENRMFCVLALPAPVPAATNS